MGFKLADIIEKEIEALRQQGVPVTIDIGGSTGTSASVTSWQPSCQEARARRVIGALI